MSQTKALDTSGKLTWRHIGLAFTCACFSFFAVALMFNAAGVFYKSVADEFQIGLGQVTLYVTLSYLFAMVLLPIGGKLMDRVDARYVYIVVNLCLAASFFIFSNAQNIYMFYVGGALMAGGTAFDMYLMPVLVARWFHKRTGLVTGICGSMTGLGAAFFNPIFAGILEALGWRSGYMIEALLILCILVPLSFVFVRSNPETVGVKPYGYEEEKSGTSFETKTVKGADYAKVIKSPAFYLMIAMAMCGGLCAMMSQYMTAFALSVGYDAMIGASLTSAVFIGTMIAKIGLGWVADRSSFGAIAGAVVLPIIGFVGLMVVGGSSMELVIAAAFLYGFVQPSNTLILPVVVQKHFGDKDYARIWGSISPCSAFACAVGATIWGWIYDGTGSFYGVFIIGIVLLAIRFVCYLFARRSAEKIPQTEEVVAAN